MVVLPVQSAVFLAGRASPRPAVNFGIAALNFEKGLAAVPNGGRQHNQRNYFTNVLPVIFSKFL